MNVLKVTVGSIIMERSKIPNGGGLAELSKQARRTLVRKVTKNSVATPELLSRQGVSSQQKDRHCS